MNSIYNFLSLINGHKREGVKIIRVIVQKKKKRKKEKLTTFVEVKMRKKKL